MLAFHMDHQFPAGVTRGMRQRQLDVLTALEDGSAMLDDERLLARATEFGRVLVTHDKGFLRLAAEWQSKSRPFAGIVFAAQQSMDVGRAIAYLELISHVLIAEEMQNRVEYIPSQ